MSGLPIPNVPGSGNVQVPGTVNGVFVLWHGLGGASPTVPQAAIDVGGALPSMMGTWAASLLADNWVVIYPEEPQDGYIISPVAGVYTDLASGTSSNGTQLLNTTLALWDQVKLYANRNWPGKKLATGGFSGGGYHGICVAQNRPADIIGAAVHCPATIWENLGTAFTGGYNFAGLSVANFDLGVNALASNPNPVMVSYGTNDIAVGWQNPGGALPTSNTDAIITNGTNVTRNATTDSHELLSGDVTTLMSFITAHIDPLR